MGIAVIGDGAMTAGMAFEAMNNAGVEDDVPLLVILNDNDMSISPPVGALNRHLARLMSGRFYAAARAGVERVLRVAPPMLDLARKLEEHAKGMIVPATLFEEFGFNYIGPIDGHDLDSLIPTLQNIKELRGPQFLHVVTKKGQGYKLAEADPVLYHGPGKFNPAEGIKPATAPSKKTYTQVFGEWLCDAAELDSRVVGITPAMREGSGMVEFEKRFPDRYFDVGIAEQHAVTFAGGLAADGMKPVVAIYSTFLQRAYDQLIHDVALQNLPVVFAIDRAGLVGADGATHAGAYDLAFLRCIPNMTVMAASDENECRQMLYTALQQPNPTAVRYPRGAGTGVATVKQMAALPLGKGEVRRETAQPVGQAHRDSGVRHDGRAVAGRRGATGCHRGQHALREAARRRSGAPIGRDPRLPRHGRRRLRDGRRGFGLRRSPARQWGYATRTTIGPPRSFHRSWGSGQAARRVRSGQRGHC